MTPFHRLIGLHADAYTDPGTRWSVNRLDELVRSSRFREQALNLLGRHCTAMGLPAPWAGLVGEVMVWTCATPGDFVAEAGRHRFQPYRDAAESAAAISGVLEMKSGASRRIGFFYGDSDLHSSGGALKLMLLYCKSHDTRG